MRVVLISVIFAVQPCPHTLGRRLGRAFASSSHCQPMGPKEHQARSPPLTLPKVNSRHKRAHPNPSKTIRNDQTRPKTRAMEKRSKTITQSPSRPEGRQKRSKKRSNKFCSPPWPKSQGRRQPPLHLQRRCRRTSHRVARGQHRLETDLFSMLRTCRPTRKGPRPPHSDNQGKSRLCRQREVTEHVIIVIVIEQ